MSFDLVARLKLQDDFSAKMRKVTDQMSKAEQATSKMTSGVSNFTKQVAGIATAIGVTALVSKGFDMIKNSIDGAIDRYDTLNNFPKIMEQAGFSTEKSQKAIDRLSEGINGLPTTLDSVAGTAQRIGVMTNDLDGAVETTLALNNAFIASGSDVAAAERGLEQYVQMLATSKVDMQSWRVLQETMGLALNDVAKAFGYTGKSAQNDLYEALKKGHITFDEFNDKIIELSEAQGGFADRAQTAAGGIKTAWKNMGTAVVRGVANIIGEIDKALGGTGSIEGIIMKMRTGIDIAFKAVAGSIGPIASKIKEVYYTLEPWHPMLKKIAIGIATAFGAIASFMAFVGVFKAIGLAIGFLTSPVGLIVLGITALAVAFQTAYEKSEVFRQKVDGIIQTIKGLFSGETGTVDLLAAIGFSPEQIEKITGFIETVKTSISEFKEFILAKFLEIQPGIQTLIDTFSTAKETVSVIFNTLLSVASSVLSALGSAFQILADVAVMVFNNVIVPTISLVWTYFQMMWSVIGPILQLLGAAIQLAFGVLKIVWDTIIKPVASYLLGEFKTALESAQPVLDTLASAFQWLGDKISAAAGFLSDLAGRLSSIKMPSWLGKLGSGVASFVFGGGGGGRGGAPARHYHGIDYVPSDGYKAVLHKGEAVITAQENKERKKGGNNVTINMNGITIREEADIDRLMNAMVRKLQDAGGAGA